MKWIYLFLRYVGITFIITECYNVSRAYVVPADHPLWEGADVFDTGVTWGKDLQVGIIKTSHRETRRFLWYMRKICLLGADDDAMNGAWQFNVAC